jgi:hypothetical protein
MSTPFDKDHNRGAERYPMLNQYAKDLERSRTESSTYRAPSVNDTNPDWPKCAECGRPFFFNDDDQKYYCNFCIIVVKKEFIEYSPYNKNRKYKDLTELAEQSKSNKEAQELATAAERQQIEIKENKARLSTQTGADNETGGYYDDSAGGATGNKHAFFQLPSAHDIVRKDNLRRAGVYADHSRTSSKEHTLAEIHPLDRELTEKGYQLRNSFEVQNRQPNSSWVTSNISDPKHRERRPYNRYEPDTGEPDVYDKT